MRRLLAYNFAVVSNGVHMRFMRRTSGVCRFGYNKALASHASNTAMAARRNSATPVCATNSPRGATAKKRRGCPMPPFTPCNRTRGTQSAPTPASSSSARRSGSSENTACTTASATPIRNRLARSG
ncbi:helix-turn-helix domain-containing protein [Paraburkholderia youngii]|uniref:helix-turn-helix domain-containing protein n=1 Tax=Paraburkholderia youngii TaxID=2782701 RepID=UPI00158FC1ED|nr:helix-turn-helix domain-containing protein [Paraburkholderia youngii]